MTDQDPFASFDSDRTVIKPSAGRGPRPAAPAASPMPPAAAMPLPGVAGGDASLALDALMSANLNPLVAACAPLLNAAPRIRATAQHPNAAALKEALADGIRKFEAQARAQGLPNEQVIAGRYILCTLLDEAASSTPWGGSGVWAGQSLLVQFHNEAFGGEKVFQLMSKLAQDVNGNRNLLELMYVALAFGFEGRYRVLDNGRAQLDSVRDRLAQMLRQSRGPYDKELSPHWQGVAAAPARLRDGLPLWVIASVTALLLMLVFIGLRLGANMKSDPVFGQLQTLDIKEAVSTPVPPAPKPRLATFLAPEVQQGLVVVQDLADRSIVTIKGDGFFEPGSADVEDRVRPLLGRIAAALNEVSGTVLITGHTDSTPIRSLRYPSNWHLSQDRAAAVKAMLVTAGVKADRLRAEGRADSEPVTGPDGKEDKAKSRRVEITLFVQPGA